MLWLGGRPLEAVYLRTLTSPQTINWRDIGTPRSYLAASHDVLSGAIGRTNGFEYASIHESALISKDVTLLPPVFVAEGCEIEAGATVGGRTSMNKGCSIGEGAMVEGSILFEGASVGEGAIVRNSIICPWARLAGNTIVRGLSVLGARCVVETDNVLDHGARVNPGVRVSQGLISF